MVTDVSNSERSPIEKEEQSEGEQQEALDADDSLTELRAQQASKRPFPPGCPVLCVTDTTITKGTVARIFIDISSLKRSFVYHVTTEQDTAVVAREEQVQWAPGCPVWLYPTSGPIWKECTILTSYQKSRQSVALFSVQQDSDGSLYHGYPKDFIRYRGSAEPPHDAPVTTEVHEKWFIDNTNAEQNSDIASTEACLGDVRHPSTQDATLDAAADFSITNERAVLFASPSWDPTHQQEPTGAHQENHQDSQVDQESCELFTSRGERVPTSTAKRSINHQGNTTKRAKYDTGRSPGVTETGDASFTNDPCEVSLVEPTDDSANTTTVQFRVPGCVFRSMNEMKDFERENCITITEQSKCRIRLFTEYNAKKDVEEARFDLTGSQEEQYAAADLLQRALLATTNASKPWALYWLACLNTELVGAQRSRVAVYQYRYGTNEKKWTLCRRLSPDFSDFIDVFVGKNGSNQKRLEAQLGCILFLYTDCEKPYWVVYGDDASQVKKSTKLIERSMNQCRQFKQQSRRKSRESRTH